MNDSVARSQFFRGRDCGAETRAGSKGREEGMEGGSLY